MSTETKNTRIVLLVCASLSLTFFLFGPVQLFLLNSGELWFRLSDVLIPGSIVCLASWVLLSLIGILLRGKTRNCYIFLVFGLTLALYIQGNYVRTDYGTLNGASVAWENYRQEAIRNTVLWIVCLAVPFIGQRIAGIKNLKII